MSFVSPFHDDPTREERSRSIRLGQHVRRRHATLVLCASVLAAVLASAQWPFTWLHPGWGDRIGGWSLTILGWVGLGAVLWCSAWFSRKQRPEVRSWWWLSVALLAHAIAVSLRLVGDHVLLSREASLSWWSVLFTLLQFPSIGVALLLWPSAPDSPCHRLRRLQMGLDSALLMGAASLLAWYFLVAPLSLSSRHALADVLTLLAYPAGDLGVLVLLILLFTRIRCVQAE